MDIVISTDFLAQKTKNEQKTTKQVAFMLKIHYLCPAKPTNTTAICTRRF